MGPSQDSDKALYELAIAIAESAVDRWIAERTDCSVANSEDVLHDGHICKEERRDAARKSQQY